VADGGKTQLMALKREKALLLEGQIAVQMKKYAGGCRINLYAGGCRIYVWLVSTE